jgi:hypothetical protein
LAEKAEQVFLQPNELVVLGTGSARTPTDLNEKAVAIAIPEDGEPPARRRSSPPKRKPPKPPTPKKQSPKQTEFRPEVLQKPNFNPFLHQPIPHYSEQEPQAADAVYRPQGLAAPQFNRPAAPQFNNNRRASPPVPAAPAAPAAAPAAQGWNLPWFNLFGAAPAAEPKKNTPQAAKQKKNTPQAAVIPTAPPLPPAQPVRGQPEPEDILGFGTPQYQPYQRPLPQMPPQFNPVGAINYY